MSHGTNQTSKPVRDRTRTVAGSVERPIVMIVGEHAAAVDSVLGLLVLRVGNPLMAVHALVERADRVVAVLAPDDVPSFSTQKLFAWLAAEFPSILRVPYSCNRSRPTTRRAHTSKAAAHSLEFSPAVDAQLRRALTSGDSAEWRAVTQTLAPPLWEHACRLGRRADRDDILQETWLSLWQQRGALSESTHLTRDVEALADECARRYGEQARSGGHLARALGVRSTRPRPGVVRPRVSVA